MKRLITLLDIQKVRPLPQGLPKERIEPFIDESQLIDLQIVLGDALFSDFMAKFDNSGDSMFSNYQKLLNGDTYIPTGYTTSIIYPGVKPMLCYFTLARFYENNQVNITRYGVVTKAGEFSEPVSPQGVANSISALRSMGVAHQEKVRKYLRDKSTTFPLFAYGNKSELNSSGVKFFDL